MERKVCNKFIQAIYDPICQYTMSDTEWDNMEETCDTSDSEGSEYSFPSLAGMNSKPGLQFYGRVKELVGLIFPVNATYVKEDPSFLCDSFVVEANAIILTTVDNKLSLPVGSDYTCKKTDGDTAKNRIETRLIKRYQQEIEVAEGQDMEMAGRQDIELTERQDMELTARQEIAVAGRQDMELTGRQDMKLRLELEKTRHASGRKTRNVFTYYSTTNTTMF
ncbi:hypothetical protein ACROYT_G015369 [Oculina patagonica]